jgi:hypothetical protein
MLRVNNMKKYLSVILIFFSLQVFAKDAAILEKMNSLYPMIIKDLDAGVKYSIYKGGRVEFANLEGKKPQVGKWTVQDDHLHIFVDGEEKTAYNLFLSGSSLIISDAKPNKNEWEISIQE